MYRMIIVDDEDLILKYLRDTFDWKALGFEITGCFTEPEQVLSHIKQHPTDVLFTDIQLGGKSGLGLAERVLQFDSGITVLLLSAFSEFEYARKAIQINVYDYMLKPVTFESVNTCFQKLKKTLDIRSGNQSQTADGDQEPSNYRIELAKAFIEQYYGEDISLDDVAAHVSMNPTYFSRFFRQKTNEHFITYLCRVRMEKAAELLRDPGYKVYEICDHVGYQSKQHFYKLFKKHTGKTPSEYRNDILRKELRHG